jgi:hypothetical protein
MLKRASASAKRLDMFGIPIEFTIGGEVRHTTICGSFVTIMAAIVLLTLVLKQILVLDEIQSVIEMSKFENLRDPDSVGFNPKQAKFSIALGVFGVTDFERYGRFSFTYTKWG